VGFVLLDLYDTFMCMFCRSLFVLLYFYFWPLCCLFFFDIRILITPLVPSISSYYYSESYNIYTSPKVKQRLNVLASILCFENKFDAKLLPYISFIYW
jgi:hypothetical protein